MKGTGKNTKGYQHPFADVAKMKLNPVTLSFPGQAEKAFTDHYFYTSIILFRIVLMAGILFYASFTILDHTLLPTAIEQLTAIRFLVVVPFSLIIFAFSFTPGFRKYWQLAAILAVVVAGAGIAWMTVIGPELARNSYYAGMILVLIYCHVIIRLRFIYATIAGWIVVGSYFASNQLFPGVPQEIVTTNTFFLTSANVMGMLGAYILEFFARREYFYSRLLEDERNKVGEINLHLEQKVKEKTMSLEKDIARRKKIESELILAKEKAEDSDRLKSAFLANVSHEIRTPMNGILGFADLLTSKDLSLEKQEEYVEIIRQSGLRMLNTINDLVKISKIEAGIVDLEISQLNLNDLTDELIEFFRPEAEGKGLDLRFRKRLPEPFEVVLADREKMSGVLTNLLKNAIKFTHRGEIEAGYSLAEEGGKLHVEGYVRDTGIGIDKGKLNTIFDRFAQIDAEANKMHEGLGLGLSIVKSYLELMDGTIKAEQAPGEGTIFRFRLPYLTGGTSEVPGFPADDTARSPKPVLAGKTILIVEDDEMSGQYLFELLNRHCENVSLVNSGKGAINHLEKHPGTDLVLMDIRMEEMDGYEAAREIRKFNKEVIIIAQTAYSMESDKKKALEAGFDGYLTKPIEERELLHAIRQATAPEKQE